MFFILFYFFHKLILTELVPVMRYITFKDVLTRKKRFYLTLLKNLFGQIWEFFFCLFAFFFLHLAISIATFFCHVSFFHKSCQNGNIATVGIKQHSIFPSCRNHLYGLDKSPLQKISHVFIICIWSRTNLFILPSLPHTRWYSFIFPDLQLNTAQRELA